MKISTILPARNEAPCLATLGPKVRASYPEAEIIVISDSSTGATVETAEAAGIPTISDPHSLGNGAAIKTGARVPTGDILVFTDVAGQHDPTDIRRLLEKMDDGHEMVIGARTRNTHASEYRRVANALFNRFASCMTAHPICDLTSGFRAVRARHFRTFICLLRNRFSYPTTITLSFISSGLPIAYVPIHAANRKGKSHIRPLTDGIRFFLIISKIGALFSPMRLLLPVGINFFSARIFSLWLYLPNCQPFYQYELAVLYRFHPNFSYGYRFRADRISTLSRRRRRHDAHRAIC